MTSIAHLNASQKEAVTVESGNVFVLAGAGTGKTSVLTHRIAWLIEEKGADISEVIAVTFTNKAAKEMKERLGKMLGHSLQESWIGTFHGVCHRILRTHYKLADLNKSFTIMDEAEQLSLIKRALLSAGQEPSKEDAAELQSFINRHKDQGIRAKDVVCGPKETMKRHWKGLYEVYEERCKQESVIDFAELLLRVYEMWRDDEEFRATFHRRFRYILVDEFQDTSILQYKWLRLLVGKDSQVFAVGDDDQCLIEGTKIEMFDGSKKPIEQVKVGDQVASKVGQEKVNGVVARAKEKSRTLRALVTLWFSNQTYIQCTPDHAWFVTDVPPKEKEFVGIVLCSGRRKDGTLFHKVRGKELPNSVNFDTYAEAFDFAHNEAQGKPVVFWGNVGEVLGLQVAAKDLTAGMTLVGSGKMDYTIEKITYEEADVAVYDIDVENYHNFVVNDVVSHNSIYSWRGAVVKNVESFITDYSAKLVKLEDNYRSTEPILKLANVAIDQNPGRIGKTLRSNKTGHEKPIVHGMIDQQEEAWHVRDKIKEYAAAGINYKNMAVIYRTNALSRTFEQSLQQSAIPFKVFGGMRFFERQEVKHALAYLKVIAAPQDDGAFLRVVNIPARGIGATSLEKLQEQARTAGKSVFETIDGTMVVTGKAKASLLEFKKMVGSLQEELKEIDSVADKLKYLMNASGLRAWYQELIKDGKEPEERLENLDELVSAARGFEKEFPGATMEDFLSVTALEASSSKTDKVGEEYVSLMTIHAAKGLEFEVVFFVGVEDGVIPNARCLESPEIEEERRLLYVAVTRAKRHLTLTICDQRIKYGEKMSPTPSRFLTELPKIKDLLKYAGVPYIGRDLNLRD